MIGRIATLYGYARQPKPAFFLKHPFKAMAARRTMRRWTGRTAKRIAAGVGAAAVAVPLGLWIGQRMGGR